MAADTFGRPVRFLIAAGQSNDILAAPALMDGFSPQAVLADRAYDANGLRQIIADLGAKAVIPSTRLRKIPIPHDTVAYRCRNRIERCFNKLKHFRRFATRFDELLTSSPSSISPQPWSGYAECRLLLAPYGIFDRL
jgi:transposase